jgi:hypothetical protein
MCRRLFRHGLSFRECLWARNTRRRWRGHRYTSSVRAVKLFVRRIEDIDKDASFIWFGGESEAQGRGVVMVYLPVALETTKRRRGLRDCGAFYVGYLLRETNWEPSMLRGVSRGEVAHLLESGRALAAEPTLPNYP